MKWNGKEREEKGRKATGKGNYMKKINKEGKESLRK